MAFNNSLDRRVPEGHLVETGHPDLQGLQDECMGTPGASGKTGQQGLPGPAGKNGSNGAPGISRLADFSKCAYRTKRNSATPNGDLTEIFVLTPLLKVSN